MPDPLPDAPASPTGPRRYVPVPGVVDLDAAGLADGVLDPPASDAAPDTRPFGDPDSPFAEPIPPLPGADPLPSVEPTHVPAPPSPEEAPSTDAPTTEPDLGVRTGPPALPPGVVDSAKAATKSRGRELVTLVVRYGKEHLPVPPPRAPSVDAGPPKLAGRLGAILPILRLVPWVLAVLFAASFFWDTETGLMRVLTVSGLIGFLTNWLAITMLFQPREKRAIIPQGLIPAQRERVIYRLSEAISRELINADIIKARIQESGVIGRYRDLAVGVVRGVVEDPGFRTDLKVLATDYATEVLGSEAVRRDIAKLAVQKVEEQAGQGLGGMALRLYRTFAEDDFQRRVDRALAELPQAITPLLDRVDAALDAVPAKVEARADEIEDVATRAVLSFVEGFDVRAMIADKARTFDEAQLEGLLKSTSNEQLNYIQYLGGILGVAGGLVIWRPLESLAAFAAVGLALWGLDEALVRSRRHRA